MEIRDQLLQIIAKFCENRQKIFAEAIGLPETTVSGWIKGNRMDAILIASKFPVRAEWLLRQSGEMLIEDEEGAAQQETASTLDDQPALPDSVAMSSDDMITIPICILQALQHQLDVKDQQIQSLLKIQSK